MCACKATKNGTRGRVDLFSKAHSKSRTIELEEEAPPARLHLVALKVEREARGGAGGARHKPSASRCTRRPTGRTGHSGAP